MAAVSDAIANAQEAERDLTALAARIFQWGEQLGFAHVGITDVDVTHAAARLDAWLAAGLSRRYGLFATSRRIARRSFTSVTGRVAGDCCAHGLSAARHAARLGAARTRSIERRQYRGRVGVCARARLPPASCATACRSSLRASKRRSGGLGIALLPIRRRCLKSNWRARRGWGGAASTRSCYRRTPGRCFFSAKF